jgi:hypothetical protein
VSRAARRFSDGPMLPIMWLMRSRLLATLATSGAALVTFGVSLAAADSVAVNGGATYASATSEMLNGVATTTDPDSSYQFEYGTAPDFSGTPSYTHLAVISKGTTVVGATVTGLTTGQKYYFRLLVFQGSYNTKTSMSDALSFVAGQKPNGGGGGGGGGGSTSGTASLISTKLKVKNGTVAIPLKCTGGSGAVCKGSVAITARGRLGKGKPKKTYKCGSGAFSATGGNGQVVNGKLSKGCGKLLAHKRHHKLHATLKATFSSTQSALTKSVTLVG